MSPQRASTLPSHAFSRRRFIATTATAFGVVATAGTTAALTADPASAATAGTFTIGDDPVALNQPTDPGIGGLTPSADAAEHGMFGPLLDFPVLPMHATLTRTGNIVSFGTPVKTVAQNGIVFDDWYPPTDVHVDTDAAGHYDGFCNAAVTLRDGRILMVSGQLSAISDGQMMTMLYDPVSRGQTMGADLAYKRWYPTALRLPNGKILILGGAAAGLTGAYQTPDDVSQVAITPEIGTGTGGWTRLTGAASAALFGADDNRWWYPRAFNSPNGGVVGFSGGRVWKLDPTGSGSVKQVGELPYDPKVSGSQVMFAPGRILVAGGGQVNNTQEATATARAAILDVRPTTPTSRSIASMHHPRNWLNLTVLPDGTVFANGGTIVGTDAGDGNAVREAELWDPDTGRWSTAATNQVTRTYHSTALLMPSGAVFTGGGGNPGPVDNFNAELYYPPYLFTKGADGTVSWAARPAVTSIAGDATHGGRVRLTVASGRAVASASLISMPSVTHSQNTDQRRIPLTVTVKGSVVTATLPSSVNAMPPGDYQLTVLDVDGVPSAAQVLTIGNGSAGRVTVASGPTKASTTGGGTETASSTGAAKLVLGSAVTIDSVAHRGHRVALKGSRVVLRTVGRSSSRASRGSATWIVRKGLGSSKGYSFESADRPGRYLVAPADGKAGSVRLERRSRSAAFERRATFLERRGVTGAHTSFTTLTHSTRVLRTIGTRVVVATVTEEAGAAARAVFTIGHGLVSR